MPQREELEDKPRLGSLGWYAKVSSGSSIICKAWQWPHLPWSSQIEARKEAITLQLCRESQKEKELLEKRMQRLETARAGDIAALQADLDATKGNVRDQLKERDSKINELIEELGNTQAMLTDKTSELAQVSAALPLQEECLKNSQKILTHGAVRVQGCLYKLHT